MNESLAGALLDKSEVTLHSVALLGLPISWFGPLPTQFELSSIFLRVCWLKESVGAGVLLLGPILYRTEAVCLAGLMSEMSWLIIGGAPFSVSLLVKLYTSENSQPPSSLELHPP